MPNYLKPQILGQSLDDLDLSYSPESHLEKVSKQQRTSWTLNQNKAYVDFLKSNMEMFENQETRRQNKVFRLMSQEIKTRSIHQVKSHHQKMLKKHKDIQSIISALVEKEQEQPLELSLLTVQLLTRESDDLKFCEDFKQTQLLLSEETELLLTPIQETIAPLFLYSEFLDCDNWFLDL